MNQDTNKQLYFSADVLEQLTNEYSKIAKEYEQLMLKYMSLQFKNADTYEYAHHGFVRRIKTLRRCIGNIWNICPPDKSEKPTQDELSDLSINLQSFMFNVFGCIDNLAWIWVKEKGFAYKRNTEVKFSNPEINKLLSSNFRDYLKKLDDWFKYLENYRHALAHRIPLYVPPFSLNKKEEERYNELEEEKNKFLKQHDFKKYEQLSSEQDELGKFIPCMTHSYGENARPVVFHAQVFADWNTIMELSGEFLKEL